MNNRHPNRRLLDLIDGEHCVYLYLASDAVKEDFQRRAESEGICFGDGAPAASRQPGQIMRLLNDGTVCFVGFAGTMRFHYADDPAVLRIDYARFVLGEDDYVIPLPATT